MKKVDDTPCAGWNAHSLRLLQADRRVTLDALAYMTGIAYGSLSLMRRGRLVPKGYQVDAIAKALDVGRTWLTRELKVGWKR